MSLEPSNLSINNNLSPLSQSPYTFISSQDTSSTLNSPLGNQNLNNILLNQNYDLFNNKQNT